MYTVNVDPVMFLSFMPSIHYFASHKTKTGGVEYTFRAQFTKDLLVQKLANLLSHAKNGTKHKSAH